MMRVRTVFAVSLLAITVLVAACSGAEDTASEPEAEESVAMRGKGSEEEEPERVTLVDKELRFVKVFYGTNRKKAPACADVASTRWDAGGKCGPNRFYSDVPDDRGLEVGTLVVSFPPDHETGRIERPAKVFTITIRPESPDKDVVVTELESFADDYDAWLREVRSTGRDQAFIYVHGYANTFADAARRAGQVAYDLDFDVDPEFQGLTMFFSWPSLGEVTFDGYLTDAERTVWAAGAFNEFLDLVTARGGVRRVHVIAHSMGNQLVLNAIRERGDIPDPVVGQLVLAAPDVPESGFNSIEERLPEFAERVTMYVSENDRALIASKKFHSGLRRVGQGLLKRDKGVDRLDAIDASALSNDFLGHSYYADNGSVLSDMYCLLKGLPPDSRPLLEPAGTAWRFLSAERLETADSTACLSPVFPTEVGIWRRWGPMIVAGSVVLVLSSLAAILVVFIKRRLT